MSNNILITQVEFARLMNVSKQAVSKAIKEKRLTPVIDPKDGKLKLNADMASAEWRRKTDLRIENAKMSSPGISHGGSDLGSDPDDDGISKESGGLYKAKTDKERMQAKILELDYKEKIGELVSVSKIKKESFRLSRLTRDAILNVPSQICNELAAEQDPFHVHQKLTIALTKALEDMFQVVSKMQDGELPETPEEEPGNEDSEEDDGNEED